MRLPVRLTGYIVKASEDFQLSSLRLALWEVLATFRSNVRIHSIGNMKNLFTLTWRVADFEFHAGNIGEKLAPGRTNVERASTMELETYKKIKGNFILLQKDGKSSSF